MFDVRPTHDSSLRLEKCCKKATRLCHACSAIFQCFVLDLRTTAHYASSNVVIEPRGCAKCILSYAGGLSSTHARLLLFFSAPKYRMYHNVREQKSCPSGSLDYAIVSEPPPLPLPPPIHACSVQLFAATAFRFCAGFGIGVWCAPFFRGQFPTFTSQYSVLNAFVVAGGGLLSSFLGGVISDKYSAQVRVMGGNRGRGGRCEAEPPSKFGNGYWGVYLSEVRH